MIVERLSALLLDSAEEDPSSNLLAGFARLVVLRNPDTEWRLAVGPIVDRLWALSATAEQQERWLRVADQLKAAENVAIESEDR
jgi:hypothetical protein